MSVLAGSLMFAEDGVGPRRVAAAAASAAGALVHGAAGRLLATAA